MPTPLNFRSSYQDSEEDSPRQRMVDIAAANARACGKKTQAKVGILKTDEQHKAPTYVVH